MKTLIPFDAKVSDKHGAHCLEVSAESATSGTILALRTVATLCYTKGKPFDMNNCKVVLKMKTPNQETK